MAKSRTIRPDRLDLAVTLATIRRAKEAAMVDGDYVRLGDLRDRERIIGARLHKARLRRLR